MSAAISNLAIRVFYAALALPCLALACSSGGESSVPVPVKIKVTPAKGGTIVVENFRLEVPVNAIAETLTIQIVGNKKFSSAVGDRLGPAFSTVPVNIPFLLPATVTFGYGTLTIPDGGSETDLKIAFLGPSGIPSFLPTTLDTTAKTTESTILTGGTLALVLSPSPNIPDNGAGILIFVREDGAGFFDLWKSNPAGGAPILLTAHTPNEFLTGPSVVNSALRIAFTETVGGKGNPRAWFVNPDGSSRTQVTLDNAAEIVGSLDSTGNFLYVSHRDPGSPFSDIAVYNLSTGVPPFPRDFITTTQDGSEVNPRISPDGQTLLYQDSSGLLWRTTPAPGGLVKSVTKLPIGSFAWRPDSNQIVIERPLSSSGGEGQAPSGGGLLEISPFKVYTSLGSALKGSGGAVNPTYTPNSENFVYEYEDTDPSVLKPTLRQIPRIGQTGPVPTVSGTLLGGGSTVFLGGAPTSAP